VPHVAFDNPLCGPQTAPRASIEMRAIAFGLADVRLPNPLHGHHILNNC